MKRSPEVHSSVEAVMKWVEEERYCRDEPFFDQVMSLDTWEFLDWAEAAPVDSLERFHNFHER
jgi:hypothetical protein